MNVENGLFTEKIFSRIEPAKNKNSRGIHTINFCSQFAVVDGYDYAYPIIGPILKKLRTAVSKILSHQGRE